MGGLFSTNLEETFRKNQEFITEISSIKMERQLHMQNQMREREAALQLAKERELFYWLGAFYLTSVTFAVQSFRTKKRPLVLLPLVPLTFIMAYQADIAYGTKLHRIRVEAEHILQFEEDLLTLPLGVPTASSIDLSRLETDEQKRLHPLFPQ